MRHIRALWYTTKIDILYSSRFRLCMSFVLWIASILVRPFNRRRADTMLMKAHHWSDSAAFQGFLNPSIKRLIKKPDYVQSLLPTLEVTRELMYRKYLFVAKPYIGPREKGVIYLLNCDGFNAFLKLYDVKKLLCDYYLVLEPDWAGYCRPEILAYADIASSPVIVEATEKLDFDFVRNLNSNFIPVDCGTSDWNDPSFFHPIPGVQKKFDCIMVCDWYNYKRNYVLIRALSKIKEHNLKALFVSNATGIETTLRNVAYHYGVQDNITFMRRLPQEQLNVLYNESKVNLLLSYKEGSNKTLFEGMFANTPAILFSGNIGVNKKYINDETGMLVEERDLPAALLMFSREFARYSPRQWVIDNISCHRTTQKINATLMEIALRNGEQWTEDLRVKVNGDGCMRYLLADDAVTDARYRNYEKS